ncbi:MAG: hypothetical protein O7B81_14335 [Gammaproteobacteria bacterium]|nr:hypothetical protein [Gammaproteobacteria bacterium]
MTLRLIELNDSGVRVFREGKIVCESPGVAIVEPNKVITGTAAQASAQLNPRAVNNQFWQHLNEVKLPNANRQVRHHADLAYHHLRTVLAQAGRPPDAVLAVPGHYDERQLALLLGIAQACDLKVSGLIDSAVAAVAGALPEGRYTVADIHQHHVTLTLVEVDETARRRSAKTIDQTGLNHIYEACVDLISDAFMEQSRFDPLHEADTEQLLYTRLPKWLEEAANAPEIQIAVEYHGNRFSAKIPTREFSRVTEKVLAPINDHLPGDSGLLLCARLAQLPGSVDHLAAIDVLAVDACYQGVAEHRLKLAGDGSGVPFVTALPRAANPVLGRSKPRSEKTDALGAATHLLAGSRALALSNSPLYLKPDGTVDKTPEVTEACAISLDAGIATLRVNGADTRLNGELVSGSCQVRPGDHITLKGGRALFIPIAVFDSGAS